MGRITSVGIAVVAVFAALAFVSVGSATATSLCSTNTLPCANVVGTGATANGELSGGTESVFTTGFAIVKCKTSTTKEKTTSSGGGEGVPVTGEITAISWSNCSCNLGGTVTTGSENLPWATELNYTSEMNGTTTILGSQWWFTCAGTKCVYRAISTQVSRLAGNPMVDHYNTSYALIRSLSGFLCSSTGTWKATYQLYWPVQQDGTFVAGS